MHLSVHQGDITKTQTDAIVNAANSSLMGGGGVDGAIHRAGGPSILEECRIIVAKQGRLPAGQAVITSAGALRSQYVIHTVGPIWRGGDRDEPEVLASCYHHSLALSDKHNLRSIAFPNISTGIYGYPKELAAPVAIEAVCQYINTHQTSLVDIQFICFDEENFEIYRQLPMC